MYDSKEMYFIDYTDYIFNNTNILILRDLSNHILSKNNVYVIARNMISITLKILKICIILYFKIKLIIIYFQIYDI